MQTITITKTVKGENGSGDVTRSAETKIGENIEELAEQFGEDVVYSHARRSIVVAMQTYIGKQIADGVDEDVIGNSLKGWKPKLKGVAKGPVEKAEEEFKKMSAEDKKRFLKMARELAAQA